MIRKKISDYIDELNSEKKPLEHEKYSCSQEFQMLSNTIRLVRAIKEPVLPDKGYPKRLATFVAHQMSKKPAKVKKRWFTGAAIAAILALVITLNFVLPLIGSTNMVSAMEKAFEEVKAYHGTLEVVLINKNGNEETQAKREVWADKNGRYLINEIEGFNKGFITVNNGEMKWQVRPNEEKVYLFEAFPDAFRFTLELGNELKYVKDATKVTTIGEETIAGRSATILEVSPKGGQSYKIWVDNKTKLPLQKETAMQNALQYRVTYTQIEFNNDIPANILSYQLPEDYVEDQTNPEQMVNTIEEAQMLAGFTPNILAITPEDYKCNGISVATLDGVIKFHYTSIENHNTIIFLQGKATDTFKLAQSAVMGNVGENSAEIMSPVCESNGVLSSGLYAGITDINSIRWQDTGFDYAAVGNVSLNELASFVGSITKKVVELPTQIDNQDFRPQIDVPVNMEIEKNEQKSVDGGSSPWKLDPVFISQVFVSLEMSPNGIEGDYPVKYEALKVTYNDGEKAIIEVTGETPIKNVYLEKLIRQDSTGIWTIVGYDPK